MVQANFKNDNKKWWINIFSRLARKAHLVLSYPRLGGPKLDGGHALTRLHAQEPRPRLPAQVGHTLSLNKAGVYKVPLSWIF